MPEELRFVENPDTGEKIKVIPGVYRNKTVKVGRHIPPRPENLDMFLRRFDQAYDARGLSKLQRITSVAASHHRYVWIR